QAVALRALAINTEITGDRIVAPLGRQCRQLLPGAGAGRVCRLGGGLGSVGIFHHGILFPMACFLRVTGGLVCSLPPPTFCSVFCPGIISRAFLSSYCHPGTIIQVCRLSRRAIPGAALPPVPAWPPRR